MLIDVEGELPEPAARPEPLYVVDGQPLHVASVAETLTAIMGRKRRKSFFICTLNMDHLVKLRHDSGFRDVYARAALVTPDGFPIVFLAKLDGVKLGRVTGADLVEPLCARAEADRVPVYLVGADSQMLDICIAKLRARYPALRVTGYSAPSEEFDPVGAEAILLIEQIKRAAPGLCFVGLGAPKQEFFCNLAADTIAGTGFIPVGAALEYIAGTKRRAPRWMQTAGLEWTWRLASEPRRLSGRYISSARLFLRLLWSR